MPARADLYATLDDGAGLLRMVSEVEPFERKKGDATEQWIQIMPFGPVVVARDGRSFQISDLLKLRAHTELPLLVDWEHQSEWGQTRAAAWVEELEVETGEAAFPRPGLWGRSVWTEQGASDVKSRAYRFLSPTVLIDKETRDAVQILAVALTNRPALSMQGLDSYRERMSARLGHHAQGEHAMTPETKKALCSQLGLSAEASDSAILEAVRTSNGDTPRLSEMCTRLTADLAAANTRAQAAEQQLGELSRTSFESEVERTLEDASKEGRITPAQAKSWREFCLTDARSFAQFRDQVLPTLPTIGDKAPSSPPPHKVTNEKARSAFGYGAEKLAEARNYIAEAAARALEDDGED
jgi:phage I-like protein